VISSLLHAQDSLVSSASLLSSQTRFFVRIARHQGIAHTVYIYIFLGNAAGRFLLFNVTQE
jgi:hypothetical protein